MTENEYRKQVNSVLQEIKIPDGKYLYGLISFTSNPPSEKNKISFSINLSKEKIIEWTENSTPREQLFVWAYQLLVEIALSYFHNRKFSELKWYKEDYSINNRTWETAFLLTVRN